MMSILQHLLTLDTTPFYNKVTGLSQKDSV